jgi:hypothetical protein
MKREECKYGIVGKEGDHRGLRKALLQALDEKSIEYYDDSYLNSVSDTLLVRFGFRTMGEAKRANTVMNRVRKDIGYLGILSWFEASGYW